MRFRTMGCEVVVEGATGAGLAAVADLFGRRDATFSRFRRGSELNRVNGAESDPLLVSEDFARMVEVALGVARATGGLVTPAVGAALVAAGYDRDFDERLDHACPPAAAGVPSWRRMSVAGRWLFRGGVTLDLNGVVKSATVDDSLALLARRGTVSAGGDIATSRAVEVALPHGGAITLSRGGLATSGTDRRRWTRGGEIQHHLVDPSTGRPADSPWQLVTVSAASCLQADVAAKAALLLGPAGPSWLDRRALAGRFVDHAGRAHENETWSAQLGRRAAA